MTTSKLTDIQLILLTSAGQRADGNILPPPGELAQRMPRIRTAAAILLKRLLVEETAVTDATQVWREDGDARLGLMITAAGRALIAGDKPVDVEKLSAVQPDIAATPKSATKIAAVVVLLRRDDGATLVELVEATGWLPHPTRPHAGLDAISCR